MGRRIARRLLDQGYRVVVWNRSPAPADELVLVGADRATDPADAARRADLVITMVADDEALREVTEGTAGVAAGIGAKALVQMSTVGLPALWRVAAALPAGAALLDAPVLGSVAEAEAGKLLIFLAGPEEVAARCTEPLRALGTPEHVGPLGSGTAAKLAANASLLGVLALLGEALGLAQRLGLPREVALRVLEATPLGAQVERRRDALLSGEYPPRFALSLAHKDADLIQGAAATAGADLRLVTAARTWFADADAAGSGERDYSAILDYILSRHPATALRPDGAAG